MNQPLYEVTLHTTEDLLYNSYTLAGLYELQQQGIVNLKIRFSRVRPYLAIPEWVDYSFRDGWEATTPMDGLARYTVKHLPSQRVIKVGLDFNDAPDLFSREFVQSCDIVFKRHYQTRYVQQLDPDLRAKLHPAGLTYGVRSSHERWAWLLHAGKLASALSSIKYQRLLRNRNIRRDLLRPFGAARSSIRRHRGLRRLSEYEADWQVDRAPFVLFQTRMWRTEGLKKTNKHEINEQRARLIRALRAAFGERFVGGVIPDDFSREHYPDCLAAASTDARQYTSLVKQAAVVIYTQGVMYSPAFKLPEYLAAAKCIVAEPLTAELPRPLVSDQEIVFYTSEQDCVDQCARLLASPALVEKLSCNAQAYYRAEVEPSARVLQMLEKAVADGQPNVAGSL